MAVTHPTNSVRSAMADAVLNQLDNGTLEFQTSGAVAVRTLNLDADAYPPATNGVGTMAGLPKEDTSANTGVLAQAEQKSSGSTIIIRCTVTATGGGGDIEISDTNISANDTVRLTSCTYTAPP